MPVRIVKNINTHTLLMPEVVVCTHTCTLMLLKWSWPS